jgi:hypothetical protein
VEVWINNGVDELVRTLDTLERTGTRYISAGPRAHRRTPAGGAEQRPEPRPEPR